MNQSPNKSLDRQSYYRGVRKALDARQLRNEKVVSRGTNAPRSTANRRISSPPKTLEEFQHRANGKVNIKPSHASSAAATFASGRAIGVREVQKPAQSRRIMGQHHAKLRSLQGNDNADTRAPVTSKRFSDPYESGSFSRVFQEPRAEWKPVGNSPKLLLGRGMPKFRSQTSAD